MSHESASEQAFAQRFESYRRYLYKCVSGILPNHELIEDVIQETYLRARLAFSHFKDNSLGGWLRRIARNLALDIVRKSKRHRAAHERHGEFLSPKELEGPHDLLVHKHDQEEVHYALNDLSPLHRDVIMLWAEGYSLHEMSEILEIPEGTVMSRISRAKQSLLDMPLRRAA